MKILQINNYHYYRGGSETVYLNTGKLLEEKGNEVAYFSSKSDLNIPSTCEKYFIEQINFREKLNFQSLFNIKKFIYNDDAAKKLEQLIIDFNPDIAHLHIFYGLLSNSILRVLKRHKIPIVMSVHEYRLLCPAYTLINGYGEICEKCNTKNYLNCISNKCIKNSYLMSIGIAAECYYRDVFFNHLKFIDKFVMVSDFIMYKHINADKRFKEKSIRIYNFTDVYYNRQAKKIDDFVYFGRLSKEKGIITALTAFKEIPSFKLKIIGTGPQEKEIKEYIKTNNLTNIKLLGYKSGKELISEIISSKFSIIPSEWYENNPMSLIESLSLGIPVIGSNIGGIPELINDSTGFLFTPRSKDSLKKAIFSAMELSEIGYKNLSNSSSKFSRRNFAKDIYYNKLIETYKDVILNYSNK